MILQNPPQVAVLSVIIPVYRNRDSLPELLGLLDTIRRECGDTLEAIFVIDGSPDDSFLWLREHLPKAPFHARLVLLSRNFGSFAAIRAGLEVAQGDYFAVMAADLQDPPEAILELHRALRGGNCDIALGVRMTRNDPWTSRVCSRLFWSIYRKLVQKEMPRGGIDIFACNRLVRQHLLHFSEINSTLVGILLWIGFRRQTVPYSRMPRKHGKSAWSFRRKLRYMLDSVLAFSDLPITLFILFGVVGTLSATGGGLFVLIAKLSGLITVPGYAATMLTILFFAGINSLGLGIIGAYVWRSFENSKRRPAYLVADDIEFRTLAA